MGSTDQITAVLDIGPVICHPTGLSNQNKVIAGYHFSTLEDMMNDTLDKLMVEAFD